MQALLKTEDEVANVSIDDAGLSLLDWFSRINQFHQGISFNAFFT